MVINLFLEILQELGYPLSLQGTLAASETYPDTFLTWWNNSSDGDSHYNNREHITVWDFDVNVYSNNPAKPYEVLDALKVALKEHDFIVSGSGYSVASDEPTHTGRGINVMYVEFKKESEN